MKSQLLDKEYRWLFAIIIILIFPAYLINIGELTFIDDEAIRALVALEMKLSGDFLTPTMAGEYYFKKPPIYNWIIAGFFALTRNYTELATRTPMLLSLLAYALSIFIIVKRKYGERIGFVSAALFLVYLRILLYESLFGLIDITYSWLMFLSFIAIYNLFQKQRWLALFSVSYFLTGFTLLLKGIPSVAFQGLALLTIFVMNKKFKKLFIWQHFVGALPFFALTIGYYYAYYLKNPEQLSTLLTTVFNESADKSAMGHNAWEVLQNIFTYFAQVAGNFIPGTLIIVFFIKKKPFELFQKDDFLKYIILIFVFCLSIFLLSPTSFMRYVLPIVSLLIIAFTVHYYHFKAIQGSKHIKIIDGFCIVAACVLCVGQLVYPLIPDLYFIEYRWLKSITLFTILFACILWLKNKKQYRLELLIITFLVMKMGFGLFIIPSRTHNHWQASMRENLVQAGKEIRDGKAALLHGSGLVIPAQYYVTAGKQAIIPKLQDVTDMDYVMYYKGDCHTKHNKKLIYENQILHNGMNLRIVKWKE